MCARNRVILSGTCFLFKVSFNYYSVRCYNDHVSQGFSSFVFKYLEELCSFTYIREQLVT